jgi:hypothetical protein
MNRRRLLSTVSAAGLSGIAGCSTLFGPDPESITGNTSTGSDGGSGSGGAVSITQVEGIDTDANGTIETLRVHVVLARGSGAVDLRQARYTLQRSKQTIEGEIDQQNAYLENGGGEGVTYEKVEGGDDPSTVLQKREDKIVVQIDLTTIDSVDPLGPEGEMIFELETAQESVASKPLEAPDTINANEAYPIH